MEFNPTAWSVLSAALVFILGAVFSLKISKAFTVTRKRAFALYLWHSGFCILYAMYVLRAGGDAVGYYQSAVAGSVEFSLGTAVVFILTTFFVNGLGLSFFGTFFAYNIFGFLGLLAFDASLQAAVRDKVRSMRRLATLLVLLPSVSFWSCAIGKDALSFCAAGLALWACLCLGKRTALMASAIGLMLFVRPHIAALLVSALAGSMLVQLNVSVKQRVLVGVIALGFSGILIPIAMEYAGLGSSAGLADLQGYVDTRQSMNMEGGSSVDISSMSVPMQLFSYLFRPLLFEADSLVSLGAALDNTVILLVFIVGVWAFITRKRSSTTANRPFLWFYGLGTWMVLAATTANLGISSRQKWMFLPMLIFLLISIMGKAKNPGLSRRREVVEPRPTSTK